MLSVEGLGRRYGGVVALEDVSLAADAGAVHGLIGPNGSGKTTLVDLATGFDAPSSGRVRLDGNDVTGLRPAARCRAGMGRTFQDLRLWPSMSVREHVIVGAHPHARRARDARWAGELLGAVGLAQQAERPAGALSLPDQRRLELARALAGEPRVLLLDEPAAGLPAADLPVVSELVASLRSAGMAVLLVEHHVEMVLELCDVVSVLDEGRLIAQGPPQQVRADQRVVEAYLGGGGEGQ